MKAAVPEEAVTNLRNKLSTNRLEVWQACPVEGGIGSELT